MNTDVQREAKSVWDNKGELEKTLAVGIHAVPELKHDEKIYYLGEFREICLLGINTWMRYYTR